MSQSINTQNLQQLDINTQNLQQLDREHHLHPFTDFHELAEKGSRIIVKADGAYIYDSEGNKILDGMSGLWTCALGYGRTEIADAVYQQLQELPYYNTFFQCAHPASIELAQELTSIAPAHMNNVFFTSSGSEANDTNIRLVLRYWALQDQPERKIIIGRKNGYHGSTIAAASLGGMNGMHKQFNPMPDIEHVDQPYFFGEGGDLSEDEFGLKAAQSLEAKILEVGAENVAAFIAEPVQGAGGVVIPPATYWPEIQRICNEYGILLIVDEVICGFGRTGEWFGSDTFGIKPDLITFAKAVTNGYQPLGGVLVGDRVADVLKADGGEFTHGYTYSGHPAACAAALAVLRIYKEDKIIERVKEISPYFCERLKSLADHPLVGEVRAMGMFGAIELVKNKETRERFDSDGATGALCRDYCVDGGVILRGVGESLITAPPLTITRDQIDELVEKARSALDSAAKDLGVS
ncbi:MAG: aspartate aminotransferase family protein [Pseudomonadales bacterium]